MRKMGTKSWIDGFVSFLFFEKRKPMHTTDCTVARGTLTGTSSVFCPWVLGDSLPVTVARPGEALLGEALLTEAVELSPDGRTSWPGPGCGDNAGWGEEGEAQVPTSTTTLYLSKPLSTLWLDQNKVEHSIVSG